MLTNNQLHEIMLSKLLQTEFINKTEQVKHNNQAHKNLMTEK